MYRKIDEFLWSAVVAGTFVILYFVFVVQHDTFTTQRVLMMTGFHSWFCFGGGYVVTAWVCHQVNKQDKLTHKIEKHLTLRRKDSGSHSESNSDSIPPWIARPLKLEEIVGTADGFELFSNHLVSEYSIENMLFVLELEIIKDEMIDYKLIQNKKNEFLLMTH